MLREDFVALAFIQLASWRQHPGYYREGAEMPPSLKELLEEAVFMYGLFSNEVSSWPQ